MKNFEKPIIDQAGPSPESDKALRQMASREQKVAFAKMKGYAVDAKNGKGGRLEIEISRDGVVVDHFDCSRKNGPRILGVSEERIGEVLGQDLRSGFQEGNASVRAKRKEEVLPPSPQWEDLLAKRPGLRTLMSNIEKAKNSDEVVRAIGDWNHVEEQRNPPQGALLKLSVVTMLDFGRERLLVKAYLYPESGTTTLGYSRH